MIGLLYVPVDDSQKHLGHADRIVKNEEVVGGIVSLWRISADGWTCKRWHGWASLSGSEGRGAVPKKITKDLNLPSWTAPIVVNENPVDIRTITYRERPAIYNIKKHSNEQFWSHIKIMNARR